jgi:hypothetical protein
MYPRPAGHRRMVTLGANIRGAWPTAPVVPAPPGARGARQPIFRGLIRERARTGQPRGAPPAAAATGRRRGARAARRAGGAARPAPPPPRRCSRPARRTARLFARAGWDRAAANGWGRGRAHERYRTLTRAEPRPQSYPRSRARASAARRERRPASAPRAGGGGTGGRANPRAAGGIGAAHVSRPRSWRRHHPAFETGGLCVSSAAPRPTRGARRVGGRAHARPLGPGRPGSCGAPRPPRRPAPPPPAPGALSGQPARQPPHLLLAPVPFHTTTPRAGGLK